MTAAPGADVGDGSERATRVAVVDDDTAIRFGLLVLLRGCTVVQTYGTVEQLLCSAVEVDVVLLDLSLRGDGRSGVQGGAAVQRVTQAGYRVLIYTNERRVAVLLGCLARGAWGVSHKAESLSDLHHAIEEVASGRKVLTPHLSGRAELAQRRGGLSGLTPRQVQILSGRARGESFKDIGARLFLSPRTVEEHMAHVTRRFAEYLGRHSPADLERALGLTPGDLLSEIDGDLGIRLPD